MWSHWNTTDTNFGKPSVLQPTQKQLYFTNFEIRYMGEKTPGLPLQPPLPYSTAIAIGSQADSLIRFFAF